MARSAANSEVKRVAWSRAETSTVVEDGPGHAGGVVSSPVEELEFWRVLRIALRYSNDLSPGSGANFCCIRATNVEHMPENRPVLWRINKGRHFLQGWDSRRLG